jgi:Double-stranded DNA deaminase toxin A
LPDFTGGKTTGVLVAGNTVAQFESGWGGPATDMAKGASGYDIVTRIHVEGNAAAYMEQEGITSGVLYINNPNICSSCSRLLPRVLALGGTLTVWPRGMGRQTLWAFRDECGVF